MTLREYLSKHQISESNFAKLIETSQAAVHRYCRGTRMPKPPIMRKIIEETGGKVTERDFYRVAPAQ